MNQSKSFQFHPEMNYEELEKLVSELSDEDKRKLVQHLIGGKASPLTVVFGVCNVVNNSPVALQLNGDLQSIVEQLKQYPEETIKLLLKALAEVINSK